MLLKSVLLCTLITIHLTGIHINTCFSFRAKKQTVLSFLKSFNCDISERTQRQQRKRESNLKVRGDWNLHKKKQLMFLNDYSVLETNLCQTNLFKLNLFKTTVKNPYRLFYWNKYVSIESDEDGNALKESRFLKKRKKRKLLLGTYKKDSNWEIGKNITTKRNGKYNGSGEAGGLKKVSGTATADEKNSMEIKELKKKKMEEEQIEETGNLQDINKNIRKVNDGSKDHCVLEQQEKMHTIHVLRDRNEEKNIFNNTKYLQYSNNVEKKKKLINMDESNIGKTFEGFVYTVNENAACIKINELNHFGLLYKNKTNLGSDYIDMADYFKKNQKVCVKILGINHKKKMYYLGNIIKYNKDIILKKGDNSRGLITKIADQYCFIKILKNGSVGYLHKSKIFLERKNIKADQLESTTTTATTATTTTTTTAREVDDDIKSFNPNIFTGSNPEKFVKKYENYSMANFKFSDIFKIWDIIDVEIYEEASNNYKSHFILTVPDNTETFIKIKKHIQWLNSKFKEYAEKEKNQSTPIDDIRDFNSSKLNQMIDLKEINSLFNKSPNQVNIKPDMVAERRKRQEKQSKSVDMYGSKKEGKRMNKKAKVVYQVNENITLSELAKLIKISLSSIKKFFIINENVEFNSSFQLQQEQINKVCNHFGIECEVKEREKEKNSFILEENLNKKKNITDKTGETDKSDKADNTATKENEQGLNHTDCFLETGKNFPQTKGQEETTNNCFISDNDSKDLGKKKKKKKKKKGQANTKGENAQCYDYIHNSDKQRNAVVTFLGHINHGKTSLFDILCKTDERKKEFGLITQNIRAVKTKLKNEYTVTFIDTPGHAAFMSIRSRGVQIADMSILVISAEEGIQEQTVECIKLIKQFRMKFLITITKTDISNIPTDRIINDLLSYDIVTELNGGDIQVVEVSIFDESSINNLQDALSLEIEFLNLQINESEQTSGVILDAYMDSRYGIVSINLIQNGTVQINDWFYTGCSFGKIKFVVDHLNKNVKLAYSSDPVKIIGYSKCPFPRAGEKFYIVKNEEIAKENAEHNKLKVLVNKLNRWEYDDAWNNYEHLLSSPSPATLEATDSQDTEDTDKEIGKNEENDKEIGKNEEINKSDENDKYKNKDRERDKESESDKEEDKYQALKSIKKNKNKNYLHFVVKCDKQGTLEVLNDAILKIKKEDRIFHVENKIVYASVGDITTSDINYAISLNAVIIGFSVKFSKSVSKNVIKNAKSNKNVKFIFSNLLYELIEDIEKEMEKQLSLKPSGIFTGSAKIVKVFNVSKLGKVAGCIVTSGIINLNSNIRIIRDDKVIYLGKVISLKIVKEEKKQVIEKDECGMGMDNFTDFQVEDIIEAYSD